MRLALPTVRYRFYGDAVKKKRNNQHRAVERVKYQGEIFVTLQIVSLTLIPLPSWPKKNNK